MMKTFLFSWSFPPLLPVLRTGLRIRRLRRRLRWHPHIRRRIRRLRPEQIICTSDSHIFTLYCTLPNAMIVFRTMNSATLSPDCSDLVTPTLHTRCPSPWPRSGRTPPTWPATTSSTERRLGARRNALITNWKVKRLTKQNKTTKQGQQKKMKD